MAAEALRLVRRPGRQGADPRGARRRRVRADRRGRPERRRHRGRGLPRLLRGAGDAGRRARAGWPRLREHTDKPVRYLVLSHYHAVRVLGASAFDADVIVAHEQHPGAGRRARASRTGTSEFGRMPRLFQRAGLDSRADLADADVHRPAHHRPRRRPRRPGAAVPRPRPHRGRHRRLAAPAADPVRRRPRRGAGRALHRRRVPPRLGGRHARPDRRARRRAAHRRPRRRRARAATR